MVRDANGQQLAWVYARATEAEARQAKVLTMDEARRTALGIAKLPALLGQGEVTDHVRQWWRLMNKREGRVERAIKALLEATPHSTFTISELARHVYNTEMVTKSHRVAVGRALGNVLARNPDWSSSGVRTRRNHPLVLGQEKVIFNTRNWDSVKTAGRGGYMGDSEEAARERYFTKLDRDPRWRSSRHQATPRRR